jgi:NADH-quinone oxidoreductase subunit A
VRAARLVSDLTFPDVTQFGYAALFLVAGGLLLVGGIATSRLLAPRRPNPEKNTSYECGEDPLGSPWVRFNIRFYTMALVFLIFDVEVLLLFPWATVFADAARIRADAAWGWVGLIEVGLFVAILTIGLVYVWANGDIDWVRAQPIRPRNETAVPSRLYEELNAKMAAYPVRVPVPAEVVPQ